MKFKLTDNYDCTELNMELRRKYKILRIYVSNRFQKESLALDLDKGKLILLVDELNKMIEKL